MRLSVSGSIPFPVETIRSPRPGVAGESPSKGRSDAHGTATSRVSA